MLKPLCCVTNGTLLNQEIPALRNTIESSNGEKNPVEKCLYVYDKAVTDYHWWDKQASYGNYMISMLKENSVATFVEAIEFDNTREMNTGIEGYSLYENNDIKFSVVPKSVSGINPMEPQNSRVIFLQSAEQEKAA